MAGADDEYKQALALHRSRDLSGARAGYLRTLQLAPDHSRAMHRLGNLDLRAGRLDDAERLIRRALALTPEASGFNVSLGNVLLAQRRYNEALTAYQEEIRLRPDFAVSYHQIGLLEMAQGRLPEALQSVQKAIFHAPRFAAAYNTLGRIYNNMGRLDEAAQALNRAIQFDPSLTEAIYNLGHVARRRGASSEAQGYFEKVLASDPQWPGVHRHLGMLALEGGMPVVALGHFEQALTLDPDDAVTQYGLGLIFQDRGLHDPARRHFERAIALAPDYTDAYCNLGAVERSSGNLELASDHFRRALTLAPGFVPALAGLAGVLEMRGEFEQAREMLDPLISQGAVQPELLVTYATVLQRLGRTDDAIAVLEQDMLRPGHRDFDRMVLHFKLGDLLDHERQPAKAIEHFRRGNALKQTDFEPQRYLSVARRIVTEYSVAAFRRLPESGDVSELPVFIVGMPRSGTTLVEQIIASHPHAAGAGELSMIGFQALGLPATLKTETPYPECIAHLDSKALGQMAQQYLQRLQSLAPDAIRVCDKMWQNYENLGLIQLMLPKARVIHCMRDPRDSLLSCYFQLFGSGGIPFSYKPEHLVAAWKGYKLLMQHWRATLKLPILEVRYEHLVADPEKQIPRIIEFLGLPWDQACLNFHENRRGVTTASYDQVRQPMYTRSVGRYKAYEQWLTPFGALETF